MVTNLRDCPPTWMNAEVLHRHHREVVGIPTRASIDREFLEPFLRDLRDVEGNRTLNGFPKSRRSHAPTAGEPARRCLHAEPEFAQAGRIVWRRRRRERARKVFP